MKKTLTIIIGVIILTVLVIWFVFRPFQPKPSEEPAGSISTAEVLGGDTTSAVNQQLESLDLGDLDAEFQQIDADLNQL